MWALPIVAFACGPFDALTSNPFVFHFYQDTNYTPVMREHAKENVELWQTLTSKSIPESHIEDAVYKWSLNDLQDAFEAGKSDNLFIRWIITHEAQDIKDFLLIAKEIEELRLGMVSKWYYPSDKRERYDSRDEAEKFANIFSYCKKNTKGRLADRIGLQHIRALFALCRYKEAIDVYDKQMSKLPDNNLFKRMAKGYVGGCLQKVGKVREGDNMYAEVGKMNHIQNHRKSHFITMVKNDPESELIKSRLNGWIGYGDKEKNIGYLKVADAALNSPKIVNRGDWLYLKAWIEEIYNGNHSKAIGYLNQALHATFSKGEMRHDAEVMNLSLKAEQGIICHDLRRYTKTFDYEYIPYYFYIVPALLKKGRVSEALLLANYASSIEGAHEFSDNLSIYSCTPHKVPDNTYANTGFQLMLSRSAREIIDYKKFLSSSSKIVKDCSDKVRHDDDYINEIIGTLFLREGNYEEAKKYLSQVSKDYQNNLNVKKLGYLRANPWVNCYMPEDKWAYPASKDDTGNEARTMIASFYPANSAFLESDENAKLNFAREMSRLNQIMKTGTPDERGLARIRYALARYNSFTTCWALTQYWSGSSTQCNYRHFYWLSDGGYKELDYLKELTGQIPNERWLKAEINKAFRELRSPEAIAEAQFVTGNYKTIAKRYPDTNAGKYLSTHCDSWNDWL